MFKYLQFLLISLLAMFLYSCGGEENLAGGVGEFKTVTVSAQAATTRMESDVLTSNTCTGGTSAGGLYSTENMTVTVSSMIYPTITSASDIKIENYTISYVPVNPTIPKPLDVFVSTIGTNIAPGASVSIDIPVAKDSFKKDLVDLYSFRLCSADYYEYYVNITFNCVEVNTGKSKPIPASFNIAFADRN